MEEINEKTLLVTKKEMAFYIFAAIALGAGGMLFSLFTFFWCRRRKNNNNNNNGYRY